jgi:hypothetical protein
MILDYTIVRTKATANTVPYCITGLGGLQAAVLTRASSSYRTLMLFETHSETHTNPLK